MAGDRNGAAMVDQGETALDNMQPRMPEHISGSGLPSFPGLGNSLFQSFPPFRHFASSGNLPAFETCDGLLHGCRLMFIFVRQSTSSPCSQSAGLKGLRAGTLRAMFCPCAGTPSDWTDFFSAGCRRSVASL